MIFLRKMHNSIPKKLLFSMPEYSDSRGKLSLLRCKTIIKDGENVPNFFKKTPDQVFLSKTKPWHGRGLHYQKLNPLLQTVTVIDGKIYECLVETKRFKSFTKYKTYKRIICAGDKLNSFVVPKGWAHGFFTKSREASLIYQVWGERKVDDEHGYNLFDPKFKFLSKQELNKVKINKRDRNFSLIEQLKS